MAVYDYYPAVVVSLDVSCGSPKSNIYIQVLYKQKCNLMMLGMRSREMVTNDYELNLDTAETPLLALACDAAFCDVEALTSGGVGIAVVVSAERTVSDDLTIQTSDEFAVVVVFRNDNLASFHPWVFECESSWVGRTPSDSNTSRESIFVRTRIGTCRKTDSGSDNGFDTVLCRTVQTYHFSRGK